jgi:tetratricopeptide (TPR) repeat protein
MTADAHCEAEALWALGRAHSGAGHNAQAATLLQRSLEMLRVIGDRDGELRVLIDLTRLRLAEADHPSAEQTADLAIAIAEQLKSRDGLGAALAERCNARLATGRVQEAVSDGEEAVALLDETRSGDRWRGYWALARALNDPIRSIELLERAVAALTEMREQIDPVDTLRRTAFTRARSGPAHDLHGLLLNAGQTTQAEAIAKDWLNGSVA